MEVRYRGFETQFMEKNVGLEGQLWSRMRRGKILIEELNLNLDYGFVGKFILRWI